MKNRFSFFRLGLLVLILTGGLLSCETGKHSASEESSPRLVILYATCTLNRDYLSPYNPDVPFTPNLENFASESIVFNNHRTESGQSGPAYASIFSGTQADKHKVYRHPTELSDDSYLIAEAYADAGFETFFWNAHGMASTKLNYAQGVKPENIIQRRMLTASDPEFLKILEKLRSDKNYRAFIVTNFYKTHGRYETVNLRDFSRFYPSETNGLSKKEVKACSNPIRPKECNGLWNGNHIELMYDSEKLFERLELSSSDISRFARTEELLYKSNVNLLDSLFGALIGQLESYDIRQESLVAFTADHGEVLHRESAIFKWSHGHALAPEVLNVPLIIHAPTAQIPAGVYDGVTRSIDVFPTLLGLSGVSLPENEEVDGVDISPALLGHTQPPDLYAYSHTAVPVVRTANRWRRTLYGQYYPSDDPNLMWVSISDDSQVYKLRKLDASTWGVEIFDTVNDPQEMTDLYDSGNLDHQQMAKILEGYKTYLVETYLGGTELTPAESERLQLLKSLGYIQ